jgi:histone H3/H4
MHSLLRRTAVTSFVSDDHAPVSFVNAYADHLQHVAEDVVSHASELAHHCGRKRVQHHDVAQAMSTLCLMCDPYTVGSNGVPVCNTLSTAKSVGGGPQYSDYCGGQGTTSQCRAAYGTCGALSGGGARRTKSRRAPSKGRAKRRARARTRAQTLARTLVRAHHPQRTGGSSIASFGGYCHDHPSQCTFADVAAAAGACDGGGRTRRRPTRTHRGKRRAPCRICGRRFGGSSIASFGGYCHDHPSQCTFADVAAAAGACDGGGRTRRGPQRRSHRRGGEDTDANTDNVALVVKAAVRTYAKDNYDVGWPVDALRLLERGLAFHAHEVATNTVADDYYAESPDTALARTLKALA